MPQNTAELVHLIAGCKAGDRKAREQLYRVLYPFAFHVALRYARDESDAAEILSHAFVKIFRRIHAYDPGNSVLHAWVKKIIIHEGLDHMKNRNRFEEVDLELAESPTVNNVAVDHFSAEHLMALVRQLPPATHAVFLLYAVDGFSHREIAEQLQISEGTSKWHLSEARKQLQKKLASTS